MREWLYGDNGDDNDNDNDIGNDDRTDGGVVLFCGSLIYVNLYLNGERVVRSVRMVVFGAVLALLVGPMAVGGLRRRPCDSNAAGVVVMLSLSRASIVFGPQCGDDTYAYIFR